MEEQKEMEKIQTIQHEMFNIVTNNETNETLIVAGNYILLKCNSIEEAKQKIDKRDYELIINLMTFIYTKMEELKKKENNEN